MRPVSLLAKELDQIPDRVAAGIKYNDEHDPGWWKLIDLDDLNMSDCDRCIRGQIYRRTHSKDVENAYLAFTQEREMETDEEVALGFNRPMPSEANDLYTPAGTKAYYLSLAKEWADRIKERRRPPQMLRNGMELRQAGAVFATIVVRTGKRVRLADGNTGIVASYAADGVHICLDEPQTVSLPMKDREGAYRTWTVVAVHAGHDDVAEVLPADDAPKED